MSGLRQWGSAVATSLPQLHIARSLQTSVNHCTAHRLADDSAGKSIVSTLEDWSKHAVQFWLGGALVVSLSVRQYRIISLRDGPVTKRIADCTQSPSSELTSGQSLPIVVVYTRGIERAASKCPLVGCRKHPKAVHWTCIMYCLVDCDQSAVRSADRPSALRGVR